MPDGTTPSDRRDARREDDIGRWNDEGGAPAAIDTDALATKLASLTAKQRNILECLGAAVVLHWDAMPTDVKRSLFRLASGDAATSGVTELSTAIARFLHDHRDRLSDR